MKTATGMQNGKNKSMYQEYRSRTKSELDCSQLLSGLSELDNQMSKYDELRRQKLSQSFIFESSEPIYNPRLSMRLEERPTFETEQSDNAKSSTLVPVIEYQKVKPPIKSFQNLVSKTIQENKFNKDRAAISKQSEVQAKLKEQQQQKKNLLKAKTKQLQQEFMQLYASDILKKSTITKQFGLLLKLLQ